MLYPKYPYHSILKWFIKSACLLLHSPFVLPIPPCPNLGTASFFTRRRAVEAAPVSTRRRIRVRRRRRRKRATGRSNSLLRRQQFPLVSWGYKLGM